MTRVKTKREAWELLRRQGPSASFLANVVLTRHREPAKRLKALARLIEAGCEVRLADFDPETLLVDSYPVDWRALDNKGTAELLEDLQAARTAAATDAVATKAL